MVARYFDVEFPESGRYNLNDVSFLNVWVKFWWPFVHFVIGKRSMPSGKNALDTMMFLMFGM